MAVTQKVVWVFTCERCEHEWIPRKPWSEGEDLPTVCPKCKSPYWNRPRKGPAGQDPQGPRCREPMLQRRGTEREAFDREVG